MTSPPRDIQDPTVDGEELEPALRSLGRTLDAAYRFVLDGSRQAGEHVRRGDLSAAAAALRTLQSHAAVYDAALAANREVQEVLASLREGQSSAALGADAAHRPSTGMPLAGASAG